MKTVDGVDFGIGEGEVEDVEVGLQMGKGGGFGDGGDLFLHEPAEDDLGGGFAMLFADFGKEGLFEKLAFAKRSISHESYFVLAAAV